MNEPDRVPKLATSSKPTSTKYCAKARRGGGGRGEERRGRGRAVAGDGDAHGLAAVEGLHALDLGEGDVVARLQPVPRLVQRRHHPGVLLRPPQPAAASGRTTSLSSPHALHRVCSSGVFECCTQFRCRFGPSGPQLLLRLVASAGCRGWPKMCIRQIQRGMTGCRQCAPAACVRQRARRITAANATSATRELRGGADKHARDAGLPTLTSPPLRWQGAGGCSMKAPPQNPVSRLPLRF